MAAALQPSPTALGVQRGSFGGRAVYFGKAVTEHQRAALISQRLTSPPDQSQEDAGKLGGGGRDVCSSRGEQDCFWRLSAACRANPFSSTRGHPTSSPLLLLLTQHLQKPGISAPTAPPPSPSCFPGTDTVHALAARPCPLVSRRGYFSPAVLLMRAFGCLPQPARLQQAQLLLERLRYHRHHGARVPMHMFTPPRRFLLGLQLRFFFITSPIHPPALWGKGLQRLQRPAGTRCPIASAATCRRGWLCADPRSLYHSQ